MIRLETRRNIRVQVFLSPLQKLLANHFHALPGVRLTGLFRRGLKGRGELLLEGPAQFLLDRAEALRIQGDLRIGHDGQPPVARRRDAHTHIGLRDKHGVTHWGWGITDR
jgi:hypothetical protein